VRRVASLSDKIRGVYEKRQYAPLWLQGSQPTPQAQATVDILAATSNEGLNPADYDAARLIAERERLHAGAAGSASERALFDVGLTAATLRYADDSIHGAIDPERVGLKVAL
jgi:murein L,D-transpeptidase YcbB/YkuD